MNRITKTIQGAQKNNKKVFIPFITAGYPKRESMIEILTALSEGGADIIEIGIPFSDPIADGPVIQSSSHTALENGVTLPWILKTVKDARRHLSVPLIFFTYLNPIIKYGIERFFKDAKKCDVDGILIPDLPPEESDEIKELAAAYGLSTIFLISPATANKRMKMIEKLSDDFVYCISVTGTTGTREKLAQNIEPYLKRVKSQLKKPYVVGFGISAAEDVKKISGHSDGVVVGSALIKMIEKYKNSDNLPERIKKYIRTLTKPLQ